MDIIHLLLKKCNFTGIMAEKKKLTPKEEMFCQAYLIDFNGAGAARKVGYSEKNCRQNAYDLLTKPYIQHRVIELRKKMADGFNATRERLALELFRIAYFDVRKLHDENGRLKSIKDLSDDEAAAIGSIEVYEQYEKFLQDKIKVGEVKKLKAWDKTRAIEQLSRLLGYNEPDKKSFVTPDGEPAIPVININVIQNKEK